MDTCLRVFNIVNALFLAVAGVLTFVLITKPSVLLILSSIYIIAFSLILCCFETRFSFVERIVYRDCGFMFRWQGRLVFFIFVGTLAFGISIIGIAAGCFTVVNVIFNIYVLCVSPNYSKFKAQQGEAARRNAAGSLAMKQQVQTAAVNVGTAAVVASVTSEPPAKVDVGSPLWEKILDEESGTYYYYNSRTKETRWDVPEGVS